MRTEPITRARIDELLAFLPLFEGPDRRFTRPVEPGESPPRYIEYTDDVEAFFRAVGAPASCWNDYDYVSNRGGEKIRDDAFIGRCTLDDIRAMLTYYIRSERFGDGSWLYLLESGRIVAVLRRLAELRETVPE